MMMADTTADSPAEQPENVPRSTSTSIHNGTDLLMELFSTELASAMATIHMAYKQQIETAKGAEDLRVAQLQQALTDHEGAFLEMEARIKQISKEKAELLQTHQQRLQEFSDFRDAADISRNTSSEVFEQQIASHVAERDDAKSEVAAMQLEVQQLRTEMAEQKLERETLTGRIQKLEGEGTSTREDFAKVDVERKQARDDAAEARGALAGLKNALSTIGLEYVQGSEGTNFYYSKEIGPHVADLLNAGQKAQAIFQALTSMQDIPGSTKKPLSPDALSPFNLATFITIMKDILSDVAVAGSGWEELCRSKDKEGNALREQRDTLSSQLSRMQEAKDKSMKDLTEIKSSLSLAELERTDTNTIVFTKGLVFSLKEFVSMKEKLGQVTNTLSSKGPNRDLEALMQIPELKLSTPQNLIVSMHKWFAIAQAIGDSALALYLSKEEKIAELFSGRMSQRDRTKLLNKQIEEESQLTNLDTQSESSSSVSTSQPTQKRGKASRSSALPSSSGGPLPGSAKATNHATPDRPIPASRLRRRTSSKNPQQTKQPTSISVPTTSTTPRKRSPSVIIVGDSDDDSMIEISSSKAPVRPTKKSRRSLASFMVSEDEKEGVGRRTPKTKPPRSKPPSKSSQFKVKKGSGKKS
ncbi:hypothetical protein IW261DRAFT_1473363 [Armillaria novae-zelandiae]|uniref:Uncharacterized protein n=1 Tax=Armillaria novae-zelandiae TaxID=153914 RepID=A0AA39UIS6_9AGAR|nr:hypothetical protein IW261DRAFT_1473363 [Armillaria novae-zelandiae]